jgi:nicotinamidase-related amidase
MLLRILALLLLAAQPSIEVSARKRVKPFDGKKDWKEIKVGQRIRPAHTAVIVCDMWDHHWCKGAERRVGELAPRMDKVLDRARAAGIVIIHAPSETMPFYTDYPQRKAMLSYPVIKPPADLPLTDPPLPIDDSKGGCDTNDTFSKAWTRETPLLHIADTDMISDSGPEIYSFLRAKDIDTVLIMGVHTNMCVLKRSFAIRQMTRWGLQCLLVRDMTDAMYNPEDAPHVTHAKGTELVVEHIEKYWSPTLMSADLLSALGK